MWPRVKSDFDLIPRGGVQWGGLRGICLILELCLLKSGRLAICSDPASPPSSVTGQGGFISMSSSPEKGGSCVL